MVQQQQQSPLDQNVPGSNPVPVNSSLRVFEFLKDVASGSRADSTATDLKIAQLKAQKKRFLKNAKKIKQRIREQTVKLRLCEQQIDNIDMNISQLQSIRDNEEEMDMK